MPWEIIMNNYNILVQETSKEEVENDLLMDEDKNKENVVSYKEVQKLHEVSNHKRKEQMIHA